jgi:hypothetical protein
MAHPSESWWSTFLDAHGRDSTTETAFLGYLYTHNIPSASDVAVLEQAYVDFQAFLEASGVPFEVPTAMTQPTPEAPAGEGPRAQTAEAAAPEAAAAATPQEEADHEEPSEPGRRRR